MKILRSEDSGFGVEKLFFSSGIMYCPKTAGWIEGLGFGGLGFRFRGFRVRPFETHHVSTSIVFATNPPLPPNPKPFLRRASLLQSILVSFYSAGNPKP